MIRVLANENIYQEVIQKGVLNVRHSLWIATANVKDFFLSLGTHTGSILEMFEQLCARKVDIRLLHSGVPSSAFLDDLRGRRAHISPQSFQMRRCIRVHFKIMLMDNRRAYIGSANFTGAGVGMQSANRRNFELGIITDEDAIMDEVAAFFLNIWEGKACHSCRLKHICAVPLETPFEEE
jgi:phosphatidylserine/phosphatidylglycerophosphate/cardiolipin synthase-like enzyme